MLINRAIKPVTVGYTYGVGIEAWRFHLQAQFSQSIGPRGILRDFTFRGFPYTATTSASYLMLIYQFEIPKK